MQEPPFAVGQSLSDLTRSCASSPLASLVKVELDGGNLAAAIQLCRDRIKAAPEDADAHRHLGQLLAARSDFLPAYRSAQRACELAPDDARTWSDLGRVYALQGQLDDATRCFTEALQVDSRFADGGHNLGTALNKLDDRAGAFTALKNALLIDPTRAETYLNLGNLLITSDQFEDAVECFERAAQHDPKLAQARSRLAQELSARGKVKRAESLFRQSLGLNPDHVQGWFEQILSVHPLLYGAGELPDLARIAATLQPHYGLQHRKSSGRVRPVGSRRTGT